MKAEWRDKDWSKSRHPERENDYVQFRELVKSNNEIIATIEQFSTNPRCFYANAADDRSGCLNSMDYAVQWCEMKTWNKVH
jgi:hypothetical protein